MEKELKKKFTEVEKKNPLKDLAKELFDEGWTTAKLAKEDHLDIPDYIFWNTWNYLQDLELGIKRRENEN